jgi:pimeloyl-ACP methyl ester carboxylesterase
MIPSSAIRGEEHWTDKGADVRLFMWEKYAGDPTSPIGTILFVHGSSMASTPTFDLQAPGRPDSSVMDFFAARGYDTWCVDMEGYGRSTKTRNNNASIAQGAEDCFAAATYIQKLRGKRPLLVYGISSGALRAALFAQQHPGLRSMPWFGPAKARRRLPTAANGSPTIRPRTGGRSIVPSCARSSPATIRARPMTL